MGILLDEEVPPGVGQGNQGQGRGNPPGSKGGRGGGQHKGGRKGHGRRLRIIEGISYFSQAINENQANL